MDNKNEAQLRTTNQGAESLSQSVPSEKSVADKLATAIISEKNVGSTFEEINKLRNSMTPTEYNNFIISVNKDMQADLKQLGFPDADQVSISNSNFAPGSDLTLVGKSFGYDVENRPNGSEAIYRESTDQGHYCKELNSDGSFSAQSTLKPDGTYIVDLYRTDGSGYTENIFARGQADVVADYDGLGRKTSSWDSSGQKTFDPQTGKETITSWLNRIF
jgi:hypothetical protein